MNLGATVYMTYDGFANAIRQVGLAVMRAPASP